jgi:ATP-dependent RNA helicase RhlE
MFLSQLFADLGLMAELTRAAADQGYTQPTPVQLQAIPTILQGRDVLAGAQTGTGKTAGFTLPLLQRLMTTPPETLAHHVRALIVTPTRELAAQVEESVRTYGKYLPLRSTVVFGGVGIAPQIEALKEGVDILVATPGRLLDHAHEQTVDLSHVEILVLDEADRMLDMGFIHDVKRILALLPAQRQNLLFSATFSNEIRELADGLLHDPVSIEVARRNAESELVAQRVHPVGQDRKRSLLAHLVKTGDWKQVLVFTRTKHGANRLAHQLGRSGISATAIHGNKSQGARTKALADFKAGAVRVLVATDLAARGLDIEELPHVVNYDLPHVAEDYVHRIGRTGRAGSTGEAISLVSPEEKPLLTEIEKLLRRTVDQTVIPGFEPGTESPLPPQARAPQESQPQPSRLSAEGGLPVAREGGEGREGRGRRRNRGRNRNRDGERSRNTGDETMAAGTAQPAVSRPAAPRDAQRNHGGHRHDTAREDRDNRGNRDTSHRNPRNVVRDDDFGNRIVPVKHSNSIRARIASGDIDEALDNIGNRMPPPPKHLRHLDTDDEINFNVAVAEPASVFDDDERQPESNAGQLFPSSAGFMGAARPGRGGGRGRRNNNGGGRAHGGNAMNAGMGGNGERGNGNTGNRGGNNGRRRGQQKRKGPPGQGQGQGQRQGQGQPRHGQQRQQPRGAARSGGGGRPDKVR